MTEATQIQPAAISTDTEDHHRFRNFSQASFRLSPETHETIRQMALDRGVSQSEVMRSAAALLKHTVGLPPNLKIATVDIEDHQGPDFYRVKEWLVD